MAGRTPSDRFEYLLDPVEGDMTSDASADGPRTSDARRRRPVVMLGAATVFGALLGVLVVSSWPGGAPREPDSAVPEPAATSETVAPEPAPAATSGPITPDPVTPTATAPPPDPSPETSQAPPPVRATQPPPAAPSTQSSAPRPSSVRAPTPTVRPPLSVSPTPRPPFPNQMPPATGDSPRGGGLLGGGGIL